MECLVVVLLHAEACISHLLLVPRLTIILHCIFALSQTGIRNSCIFFYRSRFSPSATPVNLIWVSHKVRGASFLLLVGCGVSVLLSMSFPSSRRDTIYCSCATRPCLSRRHRILICSDKGQISAPEWHCIKLALLVTLQACSRRIPTLSSFQVPTDLGPSLWKIYPWPVIFRFYREY